ncbi:MAG: D-alanine--D-alanine ligase [Exilibacterium sp.]
MAQSKTNAVTVPVTDTIKQRLGRVGVLYGGLSSEREVSLQSGEAVFKALQKSGVDTVAIDLRENAIEQVQRALLDRVFIVLHGPGGEDGRVQAMLEFMGLPYTGSGVQASSLAMDKLLSKQLWRGINLPTPDFAVLQADTDWLQILAQLGGEVMVKPVHEGSSIGMTKADSPESLQRAYEDAVAYDTNVLAERVIKGAEYTVSVLGERALPAIKLETNNRFYDYEAKYLSENTRYICPCGLSPDKHDQLQKLALKAFKSLGCSGWGRVDVMADSEDNFYLLEVNTVPGMTSHSLVPIAAKAVGMSFEELVVNILMSTLRDSSG